MNKFARVSFFGLGILLILCTVAYAQLTSSQALPKFYSAMPFVKHSRHLDTSGTWIPVGSIGSVGVKFFVNRDGIHKISYNWLQAAGIDPSGLDPSKLRLVRNGVDVPFSTRGLDDGTFNSQDAVFFIGMRNYDDPDYYRAVPLDTPHPQYLNKYSDSSAYLLFFENTPSPRMPLRQIVSTGTDTVTSHIRRTHYEPEISLQFMGTNVDRLNLAEWTREDTWIMQFIQPDQTKTLPFEMEHYLPYRDPVVRVAVAGYQGPSTAALNHKLLLRLKGGEHIDSASFGTSDQVLLEGTVPSGTLSNANHVLEVESVHIQSSLTRCVIDNYEIEYVQELVSSGNALISGSLNSDIGVKHIKISGLSDTSCTILCRSLATSYEIHPKYIVEGGLYAAVFADTIHPDTRYYLSAINSAIEPSAGVRSNIVNVRQNLPDADWLAITAREFSTAVDAYAHFIGEEYGVSTHVITVEDIYASYSYGVFNPEAIKLFLFDYFTNLPTRESATSVVFIGDANYNFKDKSAKYSENLIPGYGFPVSDMLFVAFDSLGISPQANVGRIPIRSAEALEAYQLRHESYRTPSYNEWNKTVVLISGGDAGENDAQLAFYRNINAQIASNSVIPAPFGGNTPHVYKTASPPSQFGPFSETEAQSLIQNGGVAISYVGHSATSTWDNGIDDPSFLANSLLGRPPLVTDFGCSSGKFAEPNTLSFSEKFISAPDAPGLAYIGNASFGYRSTAQSFPGEFYDVLFKQGVSSIGDAHFRAKIAMIDRFGPSLAIRNSIQMSTLLGDPILRIALPDNPDAAIAESDISTRPTSFTDALDSLHFDFVVHNYGLVPAGLLQIRVELSFGGLDIAERTLEIPFPLFSHVVSVSFPSPQTTGEGSIRIQLDAGNMYQEMSEENNAAELRFSIFNSSVKIINRATTSSGADSITVLHPYLDPGEVRGIILESDTSSGFTNPAVHRSEYGLVASYISARSVIPDGKKRYIRLKLDGVNDSYTDTYSIWGGQPLPFFQRDSADWSQSSITNLLISNNGITTLPASRSLRIVSSGPFDGSLADVLLNGSSVFPPAAVKGYFVAVINRDSMTVAETRVFASAVSVSEADSLVAFIAAQSGNKLIAVSSSADPTINLDRMALAFRSIGAIFVDSVQAQGSYAILGNPQAAAGSASERLSLPMHGPAIIDTTFSAPSPDGVVRSPRIGPAGAWRSIRTSTAGNLSASNVRIIGIKSDNSEQLLLESPVRAEIDIQHLDANEYRWLILEIKLKNVNFARPTVQYWGVSYDAAPELAMNYQSVFLDEDSIFAGAAPTLHYGMLNAGKTPAPALTYAIEEAHSLLGPGNNTKIPGRSLSGAESDVKTHTPELYVVPGTITLTVTVSDEAGTYVDQIHSNNTFRVQYYVRPDSSTPDLEYTFDSSIPLDGDFIAANPAIRLELRTAHSPILNPEAFHLSINGQRVTVGDAYSVFYPATETEPAIFETRPSLAEGTHEFRINAITPTGIMAYTEDAVLNLTVSSSPRLENVYPVPNPFTESTTFSFMLGSSEHPDRAEIKIYTIAGRLIRKLDIPQGRLRVGNNLIPWDGRDQDGSSLANGTYFFRLTLFSASETSSFLGKLSVLR